MKFRFALQPLLERAALESEGARIRCAAAAATVASLRRDLAAAGERRFGLAAGHQTMAWRLLLDESMATARRRRRTAMEGALAHAGVALGEAQAERVTAARWLRSLEGLRRRRFAAFSAREERLDAGEAAEQATARRGARRVRCEPTPS